MSLVRHRGPAQCGQVHSLQRPDQSWHRCGKLPLLHDRAQHRRGGGARPRLDQLAEIISPERVVPAIVEFVDIAGLVAGASKGEGLGNQFLAHIRETDAIVNVVRCFEDPNVIHVAGKVDPIADIEVIQTELCLADMATVEKALSRYSKAAKSGNDKEAAKLVSLLTPIQEALNEGKPARVVPVSRKMRPCSSLSA